METTRKKTNNNKKVFLIILTMIFIFFSGNALFSLMNNNETLLPENDTLLRKTHGQAVIIKDEKVYYSNETAELKANIEEGERVPVGTEVISSSNNTISMDLQNQLAEIEENIKILSQKNTPLSNNNDEISSSKVSIIESLQADISQGNFSAVNLSKDILLDLNNTEYNNNTDGNLLDRSIKSLENQKSSILEQINNKEKIYITKDAGIVSYNIDGFENIFLPIEFNNYIYENIKIEDDVNENNRANSDIIMAEAGKPLFKIINNFEWYTAIKIDNISDIEKYQLGNSLSIEFEDDLEIQGRIISINITGEHAVLVLKFNEHLHENYKKRFLDLSIVTLKKDCYKIPNSVIIEKDGVKGVLIEEVNGIVKFRQISILDQDEDYAYIDKGNGNGYITVDNSETPVRTVLLYDEIIVDPKGIEEGDILK